MPIDESWDALDAYLADPHEFPEPPPDPSPPEITNADEAEMLLRRMGRINRQVEADRDAAKSQIDMVQRWLDDRIGGPLRYLAIIERALDYWWRANRPERGSKSLALPSGRVSLRAPGKPAVMDLTDEQVADLDPALTTVTVAMSKSAINDRYHAGSATGDFTPDGRAIHFAVDASGAAHPTIRFLVREDAFKAEPIS